MTQKPTNSTKYGDYAYGSYDFNSKSYGDGDIPEIDYEPYRNGSHVVTPTDPKPNAGRKCLDATN